MNFLSCLSVILGLAFLILGIAIKLRKKDQDQPPNQQVEEKAIKKKITLKPDPTEISYGPIQIFFGSQTGTAASFAKILGEEAVKNGFKPKLIDLIDFDSEYLQKLKLVIFVMATHGEGEPTDNAKGFTEWITDSERSGEELKGQKFTVFGLGDKNYQNYNAQGKKVNKYMEKLGGERVYKYGEGDDNGTLEDEFNEWKSELWEELKKVADATFITNGTQSNDTGNSLPFILSITKEKEVDLEHYDQSKDQKTYEFQMKQYLSSTSVKIVSIRELRQKTEDGSSLHIEIDCGAVGMSYKTAENLSFFPENCPDMVDRVTKVLGLDLEAVFTIQENKDLDKGIKFKYPFPTPLSVRTYLTKFCDLRSPIRKKQLKEIAEFCPKKRDKEKLLFLASNNGKVEFEAQVQSSMLGLIDILEQYEVHMELENLVHIASLIQPRYYTIASSSQKDPNTVHLCCTVHTDVLPNGSKRVGVASAFMVELAKRLKQGLPIPRIKVDVKESTFQLPKDNNIPVYMVGPGAGIAPFRGFIEEKAFLLSQGKSNPFGEMTLYFGCRARNWDYLYKEELLKHQEDKVLENYHVAFSREKEEKVYVQNLLEQNKNIVIRDFFERNATFYICGAMGMGKSIIKKLGEFAAAHYKIDMTEAVKKIEEMEKNKRIIKELWG